MNTSGKRKLPFWRTFAGRYSCEHRRQTAVKKLQKIIIIIIIIIIVVVTIFIVIITVTVTINSFIIIIIVNI